MKNVQEAKQSSIEATHNLKKQALWMKEAILKGELDKIGEILKFGWENKKLMAKGISNPEIDNIYKTAIQSGASGGKISGAGGGGFMFFYCPANTRFKVKEALEDLGGYVLPFEFNNTGLTTWRS
jgi:D-glycero-alpha-D-manno-heptose-7-phosphate kinase